MALICAYRIPKVTSKSYRLCCLSPLKLSEIIAVETLWKLVNGNGLGLYRLPCCKSAPERARMMNAIQLMSVLKSLW